MNLGRYHGELPPRRSILSGGAVFLEVPVPTAHAVSFGLWVRRGSAGEAPGREGITHFIEHMVFKGTPTRDAYAIATAFDAIGAMVDAFTTKDYVAFTLKVLPEFFGEAVSIMADMVLRPALDPQLIGLEQDVVCEEIQEALDTPEDRLHDAFASHVYQRHHRGRPILGTPETVRSFDRDLLVAEHRQLFSGPNLVLVLAGNLEPGFRDLVATEFSDLAAPTEPNAISPPAPDPALRQPSDLVIQSPVLQTYFEIGNLGVATSHPDRVPLLLLSNLLGGGMSSRIFQAVREREGLAYTVYTYTDMGLDTGLVSCAGSCTPEKEARVREVVRQEYRRLLTEGVTGEELESNKAQIKSQIVFALEGGHNQLFRAARNEIYFGRFLPVTELVTMIDSVDQEAIRGCAGAWFDPDRLACAVHRPGSA